PQVELREGDIPTAWRMNLQTELERLAIPSLGLFISPLGRQHARQSAEGQDRLRTRRAQGLAFALPCLSGERLGVFPLSLPPEDSDQVALVLKGSLVSR